MEAMLEVSETRHQWDQDLDPLRGVSGRYWELGTSLRILERAYFMHHREDLT